MTSVKASLAVVLKANDVVVAEVEDAKLWQRILSAINDGKSELGSEHDPAEGPNQLSKESSNPIKIQPKPDPVSGPLAVLSGQVGIDGSLLEGGCSFSNEPPFLRLNPHCWEEMKKQLPQRGSTAVAPVVAAATMLGLWSQAAGLGTPTQAQAQEILATINLHDPNASRSIRNATWIQPRSSGQFVLNPAEISKSVMLIRCFCCKDWKPWKEAASS